MINTLDKTFTLAKPPLLERYPELDGAEVSVGMGLRGYVLDGDDNGSVTYYKGTDVSGKQLLDMLGIMLDVIPNRFAEKASLIVHVLTNVRRNTKSRISFNTVYGISLGAIDAAPECVTLEIYVSPYRTSNTGIFNTEVILYIGATDTEMLDKLWTDVVPPTPGSYYRRTLSVDARYPELAGNETGGCNWHDGHLTEYELDTNTVWVYQADDVNENTLRDVWNSFIKLLRHVEFTKIAYRFIAEFPALADADGVIDKSYYHQGIDSSVAVRYHIPVSTNGRYNPEIIVYKGDPNTETYRTMTHNPKPYTPPEPPVNQLTYEVTDVSNISIKPPRRFARYFGRIVENRLMDALSPDVNSIMCTGNQAYPGTVEDRFLEIIEQLQLVEPDEVPVDALIQVQKFVNDAVPNSVMDFNYTALTPQRAISFNVFVYYAGAGITYCVTGYTGSSERDFILESTDLVLDMDVAKSANDTLTTKRVPWNTPVPAILGTDVLKADCIKHLPNRLFHRVLISYAGTAMSETILGDSMLKQAITAAKSIKTHYGNRQYNFVIELPEVEGIATIWFYTGFNATEVDDLANEFLDKVHDLVRQLPSDMAPDGVVASMLRLLDGGHRGLGYILTPRESNVKARSLPDNLSRRWVDRILRHDPK